MIEIKDKSLCSGCAACVDSCNHKAITLKEDIDGFFFPVIDKSLCVDCGLCEKSCHYLHQDKIKRNDRNEEKLYAAWTTNKELISKSASGGIFPELALYVLQEMKGVVYGAVLLQDSSVKHISIESTEELSQLQGSKYRQSVSVGIYRDVKEKLRNGRHVLFSGTPCQIAALYTYLNYNERLLQNLFTAELICHGVPTNYTAELALKLSGAEGIHAFRTKSKGWKAGNRSVFRYKDGKVREFEDYKEDFLFRAFLSNDCLRASCYTCPYACMDRIADISMADFWYNGKDMDYAQNFNGTSLVLVNSPKGNLLWNKINKNVISYPVTFEQATRINQSVFMPQNFYYYILTNKIHLIKKLPIKTQRVIFQNRFTNRYLHFLERAFDKLIPIRRMIMKKKRIIYERIRQNELSKIKYVEK